MNIFEASILGLIQGASEFLPISSSAHLVIAPWLFGFSDPGLAFDVALHIGTLVAVILYFFWDWVEIFRLTLKNFKFQIFRQRRDLAPLGRANFKSISNDKISNSTNTQYNKNILWFLILATIPGVLAGYFLESYAETSFRSPLIIAFTLSFVGLVLYLVDKYHQHRKNMNQIRWLDSLLIGLSQALAIIPGVSRSGATITTGLALGLNRQSSARFSFLLSTPIILGAAVFQFPNLIESGINSLIVVGVLSSAVSGFFAIKYLLKFLERSSYAVFFWYRLLLGVVILIYFFFFQGNA